MADIRKIFYPESIAVVGATENLFKWGSYIFTNIIAGGFKGKVYPVAKNKRTIYGHRAYGSVAEIQDSVDLVFITTPAASVMGVLADCVVKGVKNVVMITSGFSETGEEGKRLEEEMVSFAKANGINVVGPNTMGIVNTAVGLYATGRRCARPRAAFDYRSERKRRQPDNGMGRTAEHRIGKFVGSERGGARFARTISGISG
jgi:acyl-CoA synthetase (NDP forming)